MEPLAARSDRIVADRHSRHEPTGAICGQRSRLLGQMASAKKRRSRDRREPLLSALRLLRPDPGSRRGWAVLWRTHLAGRPAATKLATAPWPHLVTALLTLRLRHEGSGEHPPRTGQKRGVGAQRGRAAPVHAPRRGRFAPSHLLPRLGAGCRMGASGAQGTYNQDAYQLRGPGLH